MQREGQHRLPGAFQRMRRALRRPHWVVSSLAAAAAYVILLHLVENWRAERAWQAFRRDLIARGHLGEPTPIPGPRLADEQNFLKAPLTSAWFNPDRPATGAEADHLIQLNRNGDRELIGSWSDVRPADLKEWRRVFHQPIRSACVSPEIIVTPRVATADAVVPIIAIDDVPLRDSIRNLAHQAGMKLRFDPLTFGTNAALANPQWQPNVTVRFENVTVRQALDVVLNNYGLRLVVDPKTGISVVTRSLAAPSGWPHECVDVLSDPLPEGADERVLSVTLENLSGADAVRNAARQAGINFHFDAGIPETLARTNYSLSMSNTTPRELLARVMSDHRLVLKSSRQASIYLVARSQPAVRRPQDNTAAGVLASLDEYENEFAALYAASERPGCQAEQPLVRRFADQQAIFGYKPYWKVSEALTLHASALLSLGRTEMALRDATVLACLIESLRYRDDLVGASYRLAMCGYYTQLVWEGLASQRWSEAQLRTLERQMQTVDLLFTTERALLKEQRRLSDWLEQTPRGQLAIDLCNFMNCGSVSPRPAISDLPVNLFIWGSPRGWIRQNQLEAMRRFETHFALLDAAHQRVHPDAEAAIHELSPGSQWSLNPYDYLAGVIGPYYPRIVEITARQQNGLNMARIACALERYRLKRDRFPDALASLTSDHLPSLPHDVTSGQPFNYHLTDDGQFELHGNGWNQAVAGDNWWGIRPIAAEWIWRYPSR